MVRIVPRHLAPFWLRDNPFLIHGFRSFISDAKDDLKNKNKNKTLGLLAVLRTAFNWHNESVNIWTHLLGSVFFSFQFLLVVGCDPLDLLSAQNETLIHPSDALQSSALAIRLVFACTFVCYAYCFGCSALFHTLGAHSEQMYMRTLRLDYSGISAMIGGSYLVPLYFAYSCWPGWQLLYIALSVGTSLALVVASLFERFHQHEFHTIRIFLWTSLGVFGVVPTLHHRMLRPQLKEAMVRAATTLEDSKALESFDAVQDYVQARIMFMYVLFAVGMIVYVTKCPERCAPGRCDFLGASHQLWHVFTLSGALLHFGTMLVIFDVYRERQSECAALASQSVFFI